MKFSLNDFKKSLVNNSTILLSFFSHPDLLKWTRNIVDASTNATPYDDKVDEIYIQTKIGGGNHRLFDESHTLSGIFEKVRETWLLQHIFGTHTHTHTPKTFTKQLKMDFFHNSWLGGLPGVC